MSQSGTYGQGGGGGGGIISIAADQGGSVTGPNTSLIYSGGGGSTTYTYVVGNTMVINATDANFNTLYGLNAGGAFGQQSGNGNCGFGYGALNNIVDGSQNTAVGYNSLTAVDSGSNNTAIGYNSGIQLDVGDSNNILIGNEGILGDNNTIRIGNQGSGSNQQNKIFVAGINGSTGLGTTAPVVIDTTTGQLGTSGSFAAITSFIPTLTGSTTAGTTTYSFQLGAYSKIGNIVTVTCLLTSTASTGTGDLLIGNLPFIIAGNLAVGSVLNMTSITYPAGGTSLALMGLAGTNTAKIYVSGSATVGGVLQIANTSYNMQISLTYLTT